MLFIITHSSLSPVEINTLTASSASDNLHAIIMTADGVYNQQKLAELLPKAKLYALKNDMTLRGTTPVQGVTPITTEQLVALSVTHYPWITL